MRRSPQSRALAWLMVSGAALALPLATIVPARAQSSNSCPPQPCPPPPCAAPTAPPSAGQPPSGQPPSTAEAPSAQTPESQQQAAEAQQNQNLPPERGAAVGGETVAQNMAGDFIGPRGQVIPPTNLGRTVTVPIAARADFKLADNDSPLPQDRLFVNYNYFNLANASASGLNFPRVSVHRETFGFEKTFLDGAASIEFRAPIYETSGAFGVAPDGFGDLTVVLKLAAINDQTGDVLGGGLAVTAPSGLKEALLVDGSVLHDTLLQPWSGFILNSESGFYIEGISSLVNPTDVRDDLLWFNDIAFGYWLYRDRCQNDDRLLTGIIPVLEGHLTTSLNHRNADLSPFFVPDQFVLTSGTHLVFNHRSSLFLGGAIPLTGPKPFDFEVLAQFNLRF